MRVPRGVPSASGLQTPMTCPGAYSLPQVGFASEAGGDGVDHHATLDRALEARRRGEQVQTNPWLDAVLEKIGTLLDNAESEVAYSYDPETGVGERHGSHLGRNYPERRTHVTINGTVDYVVESSPGEWLVVDLKTGLTEMPPAARLWQLRHNALAVAAAHGAGAVRVAILHAPRDGRSPWVEWGPRWDVLDLVSLRDELRAGVTRILGAQKAVAERREPWLVEGRHCEYCPARWRCPVQVEALRRLAGAPDEWAGDLAQALVTEETAAKAYARWRAAKKAVDWVGSQLHAWAKENGGVPVSPGRRWGPRQSWRTEIEPEMAWTHLAQRFGADVARSAMTLKTSRAALERALTPLAPRGQKAAVVREVIEQLTALGAVTTRAVEVFEEFESEVALPAADSVPPAGSAPVLSVAGDEGAA